MSKIAGVTVLYNPDISILENISSYLNQVVLLYVVNNSDENLSTSIITFLTNSKVKLIENSQNLGMAYALNQAAKQAINDGFEFLLTMDQDSKVSENLVDQMLKKLEKDELIGIISPYIVHTSNPSLPASSGCFNINVAMTSGNVLRLSAYKEVGEFLEKLFIDYVDHEYCLRMNLVGYKVVQLNSAYLYHNLGNIKQSQFLLKKVFPTNHSPLRLYYRTRNRFYIYKLYQYDFFEYIRKDKQSFFKELLKISLYEKQKISKVHMIIRGYVDYRKGIFGKFKS